MTARALGATLAAVALALALLAGCGGGRQTAPLLPVDAPKKGCDARGPNSLAPAVCQSSGLASLDPSASRSFVAPDVADERAACTSTVNAVFYAADDWIRLAQSLAKDAFPCADYYISIPPVQDGQGFYTTPTPGQVPRLRALGPRFHALAEIRVTAWQQWLAAHAGKTWYDAGVEARRRMAAAGYDPAKGDTWAVNELPLDVLTDLGMRNDMRELVRGLHDGGTAGPTRGLVFVVEPEQGQTGLASYKAEKKRFYADRGFWAEMTRSVRFWGAEVYASTKSSCVRQARPGTRAAKLNQYLQHGLTLADAGPPRVSAATRFFRRAYTPIGNAAWRWSEAYGFTDVPADAMGRFVAEQAFAVKSFAPPSGGRLAGFGFAWAPVNETGVAPRAFVEQTGSILGHLARSVDRLGGLAAAAGSCDVDAAAFNDAWAAFDTWR